MKTIGLFYATREGQTRKIIRHVADRLIARGFDVELWNVKSNIAAPGLFNYEAVILAASVHTGRHEGKMIHGPVLVLGECESDEPTSGPATLTADSVPSSTRRSNFESSLFYGVRTD